MVDMPNQYLMQHPVAVLCLAGGNIPCVEGAVLRAADQNRVLRCKLDTELAVGTIS